jgi:hypothetical protein
MSDTSDPAFQAYKRAETKALEILTAMKGVTPKKVDIELALLVALFELHKGSLPAANVAKIIQGHLEVLVPHYTRPADGS